MINTVFGVVAGIIGFVMIATAGGNAAVALGGIVVLAVGLGFVVYGSGR